MSWKEKEEDPKVSTKKTAAQPAPRKKGKELEPPPPPQYLNLYEDIEDPDEPFEPDAPREPTTSKVPQVGTSRSAGSTEQSAALQSTSAVIPEEEMRLERLREARRMVSVQIGCWVNAWTVLAITGREQV